MARGRLAVCTATAGRTRLRSIHRLIGNERGRLAVGEVVDGRREVGNAAGVGVDLLIPGIEFRTIDGIRGGGADMISGNMGNAALRSPPDTPTVLEGGHGNYRPNSVGLTSLDMAR